MAEQVETGEFKYSSMEAGFASRYVIDQSTDQMLGLSRQYMQKLNLSSGLYEYESTLVEEIFKEYECKPDYFNRRFPVIDSHIIFCDRWKSVIGSLDYENMRIDWTHDLFATRDYAMISDLKCFDGKIYVLDNVQSGNSLHVFEKMN